MTTKALSFKAPPQQAIAEGATSPNPGIAGVQVWSTTLDTLVTWNGTTWNGDPIATPVTDTKPTPVGADKLIMLDSEEADNPVIVTGAQLIAALGGSGGSGGYYVGTSAPDPSTYPLWYNTTDGVFLVRVSGNWVEPGASYIPGGGSTGQVLVKASGDDHDYTWGAGGPSPLFSWVI